MRAGAVGRRALGLVVGLLMCTGAGSLRLALRAGARALRLVRARTGACCVNDRGRGAVAAAVAQTQKL